MLQSQILAVCLALYTPDPLWDRIPLPENARVVEVPFDSLKDICKLYQGSKTMLWGCINRNTQTAYVSTWKTWPGSRFCWLESIRHETAHLKGWEHR